VAGRSNPAPVGAPDPADPTRGGRASWVLGIADGPTAGAALVDEEGALAFAVDESALSRRAGQGGFPHRAVAAAAAERLARGGRIEAVAVADRTGLVLPRLLDRWVADRADGEGASAVDRLSDALVRLGSRLGEGVSERASRRILHRRLSDLSLGHLPFALVDHHDCHAWAAGAGADDALIVTMDASEDGVSGGVYRLERGEGPHPRLRRCRRVPAPHGPGALLEATARLLDVVPETVRHLATSGDRDRLREAFARALPLVDGLPRLDPSGVRALDGLRPEPAPDVAAAMQAHIEAVVIEVVRGALHDFGGRRLRLAGEVFANPWTVRAVTDWALTAGMQDVFVFPATRGAGLASGAALAGRVARGGPIRGLSDLRIGPLAWDESAPIPLRVPPLPLCIDPRPVRGALHSGESVARCLRRLEIGAAPQGARGLLLAGGDVARADILQDRLGLPRARRFQVLLRAGSAAELLGGWTPELALLTRYAAVTLPALPALRASAPAAVYPDGTVRARVLRPADDPTLHALLADVPGHVLLETPLALPGEPTACSLAEAATAAAAAGAALLWVG
jgi:predicted NodU family carbamoyl transferase